VAAVAVALEEMGQEQEQEECWLVLLMSPPGGNPFLSEVVVVQDSIAIITVTMGLGHQPLGLPQLLEVAVVVLLVLVVLLVAGVLLAVRQRTIVAQVRMSQGRATVEPHNLQVTVEQVVVDGEALGLPSPVASQHLEPTEEPLAQMELELAQPSITLVGVGAERMEELVEKAVILLL
jgi:hypothetical protein